ncbi:MAG: HEAT repeat domain-containing protein [Planctomycetia bacterium]
MSRPLPGWLLALPLAGLLAAAASPASAEGSGQRPRPRPKDFDFGAPQRPAPGTAATPAAPGTPKALATPGPASPAGGVQGADEAEDTAVRAELERLGRWPAREGVHAAESLLLRGPAVAPWLVEALAGNERSVQPGAAWVLGKVGTAEHVVPILRAAARLNGYRAETFFEAALGLEPERTKEWLVGFLSLDRSQLREASTEYLRKVAGPEDAPRVLRLLDSDKAGARSAGLRLLDAVQAPDREERLVRALSDLAPGVARTAAGLLAVGTPDAAALARLNTLAREGEARERAYAVVALADATRLRTANAFEPATVTEVAGRRGVLHPDKLNRVAAAVGLAYGATDTQEASIAQLLDGLVIDTLVDGVGGDHYRDFDALADSVFAALRRLSGQDLPSTAVAWAQWWQRERGSFHARRSLKALEPADLPFASVRYEAVGADGARRSALFVPEGATPREGALVLPRDVFGSLVAALGDLGIFEGRPLGKARSDEHVLAVLQVRNQDSRVRVGAREDATGLAVLRARFEGLEDANSWQLYRDTDRWPEVGAWWAAQSRDMAQADPDLRAELLRSAIVNAWDDLASDEARASALDRLEALGPGLTAVQARVLLEAATARPAVTALEMRAVRMALALGPQAEARQAALQVLGSRSEPEAVDLLARLLADSGAEAVRMAFLDPAAPVRCAAARAATLLVDRVDPQLEPQAVEGLGERLRPGLEVLRKDEVPVRAAALVALGRLGDASVLPQLEQLYREGDLGQRALLAQAFGELPGDQGHGPLTMVLGETDAASAPVRTAALRAVGRTRHPNAVRLLTFYLLNDPSPDVQRAAGDTLVALGSDEARLALLEALTRGEADATRRARLLDVLGRFEGRVVEEVLVRQLDDTDPGVVAVVALRAGQKGLPASVPHLIALLRRGSEVERDQAVAVLEELTCQRLVAPGFGAKADQLEAWWATAKVGTERDWLRDALAERGYDTSALATFVRGEPSLAAVPVLLRALRDADPVFRQAAARALERITGRAFGDVGRGVPAGEAARVADRWSAWYRDEAAAQAPRR